MTLALFINVLIIIIIIIITLIPVYEGRSINKLQNGIVVVIVRL